MTFNEYKKQLANYNSRVKSDAYTDAQYKLGDLRRGMDAMAMDPSYKNSIAQAYNNSMAPSQSQAYESSQNAQLWKSLVDQARTNQAYDDNATIERQKELLAIRAKKKKIIQQIDELKKELQQRTQLQAFEDKYKDSPFWKLAKKHYIDTGDMSAIESFVTRENALQEAIANREFTSKENELNRKNTSELHKAQKTEQLEYNLDEAQEKVELAQNKLKSAKAIGVPVDIKDAQIAFNAAVKRLNKIREQLGMGDSDYKLESYDNNEPSDNKEISVQDILDIIPTNYRYKTNAEKEKIMNEIKAHPAYNDTQDKSLRDAYIKIRDTKTQEEINKAKTEAEEKAKALWNSLGRQKKFNYQNGLISYDKNNPDHVLLKKYENTFEIDWKGGK